MPICRTSVDLVDTFELLHSTMMTDCEVSQVVFHKKQRNGSNRVNIVQYSWLNAPSPSNWICLFTTVSPPWCNKTSYHAGTQSFSILGALCHSGNSPILSSESLFVTIQKILRKKGFGITRVHSKLIYESKGAIRVACFIAVGDKSTFSPFLLQLFGDYLSQKDEQAIISFERASKMTVLFCLSQNMKCRL